LLLVVIDGIVHNKTTTNNTFVECHSAVASEILAKQVT